MVHILGAQTPSRLEEEFGSVLSKMSPSGSATLPSLGGVQTLAAIVSYARLIGQIAPPVTQRPTATNGPAAEEKPA